MARERLSSDEIERRRQALVAWTLAPDGLSIEKSFKFDDFAAAFGFMAQCAVHAEKLDHHPEWFNSYRRVDVRLTTHSAKGLTELDFALARCMDRAAGH